MQASCFGDAAHRSNTGSPSSKDMHHSVSSPDSNQDSSNRLCNSWPYLMVAISTGQKVAARRLPSSSEILRETKPRAQPARPRTATAALEDAGEAKGKCGVHPMPQPALETDLGILWVLHTWVCIPMALYSSLCIHILMSRYISC